ncbi:N-acetylglucosamine-6-phosphate deacetylase [Sphingobium lactosutens]|uniref:N-acetylglucosamine-6-phosphate deacetylase n=1 Tax=Sphingobium lactosutens TaxID=522773 RepID=UPI0015C01E26|nr:N-acetylglucosamine-6-phosphate deacetylase [Sphingobium lactosutens]NWK96391.1 N-acetylglucosamine-6-phosphate deacetylase [Sphingobium lactosutens]
MSSLQFVNGTFVGTTIDRLVVEDGIIVTEPSSAAESIIDLQGGYLLPGFIDTQVNGGGDVLFNDSPTVETIARIGAAHRPFGTTSFLPTLISDDLDKVDAAMRAVEQAIDSGIRGVVGIHLEGPFLNAGRKGTHDATKFRRLDKDAIALLSGLRHGRTLVTLAPECCDDDQIRQLVEAGVTLAVGHSDADHARTSAAFAAGMTGVTHLYNAMSPLNHRAPGVVGATLENDHVYAGIIVDGQHVSPAALRIALRARPRDRFMLVTDAMPTVGSATKCFTLQGKRIRVRNGVCIEENETLAGSDLDMASALRNAMSMMGLPLADASFMASGAPAHFLDLQDRGRLASGLRADLLWLDADHRIRAVWQGGALTFSVT